MHDGLRVLKGTTMESKRLKTFNNFIKEFCIEATDGRYYLKPAECLIKEACRDCLEYNDGVLTALDVKEILRNDYGVFISQPDVSIYLRDNYRDAEVEYLENDFGQTYKTYTPKNDDCQIECKDGGLCDDNSFGYDVEADEELVKKYTQHSCGEEIDGAISEFITEGVKDIREELIGRFFRLREDNRVSGEIISKAMAIWVADLMCGIVMGIDDLVQIEDQLKEIPLPTHVRYDPELDDYINALYRIVRTIREEVDSTDAPDFDCKDSGLRDVNSGDLKCDTGVKDVMKIVLDTAKIQEDLRKHIIDVFNKFGYITSKDLMIELYRGGYKNHLTIKQLDYLIEETMRNEDWDWNKDEMSDECGELFNKYTIVTESVGTCPDLATSTDIWLRDEKTGKPCDVAVLDGVSDDLMNAFESIQESLTDEEIGEVVEYIHGKLYEPEKKNDVPEIVSKITKTPSMNDIVKKYMVDIYNKHHYFTAGHLWHKLQDAGYIITIQQCESILEEALNNAPQSWIVVNCRDTDYGIVYKKYVLA